MKKEAELNVNVFPALDYIEALAGDKASPVCFQTFSDNGKNSSLVDCFHESLEKALPRLEKLNKKGAGVFVTVNELPPSKKRRSENITKLRALFIDQDGLCEIPTEWKIKPSVIVKRDSTHWHAYWLLVEGENLDQFKPAQKALARYYKSDPAVNDLARVMRVPGFLHNKKNPVKVDLLYADKDLKYSIKEILEAHGLSIDESCTHRFLKEEYSIDDFKSWASKKATTEGERHKTATNIAIEGCGRKLEKKIVLETVGEYLKRSGKNDPTEANKIIEWVYEKEGNWNTYAKPNKTFDMDGFIEDIKELAVLDLGEAANEIYRDPEGWSSLKSNEYTIFRDTLKRLLGDHLDKNQMNAIRFETLEKLKQDEIKEQLEKLEDKEMVLDKKAPLKSAKIFIKREFFDEQSEHQLLEKYAGEFWHYNGNCYEIKEDEWLRKKVYEFLDKALVVNKNGVFPFEPTSSSVSQVLDALIVHVFIEAKTHMPFWTSDGSKPDPQNIIAFNNGLLDIEDWKNNPSNPLIEHTPEWFSSSCLPFNFDPNAKCPVWEDCLNRWFDKNEDTIEAFRLFFGYLISQDTRQQKIGLFLGAPRSGKGTTGRVLMKLLGDSNIVCPTLGSLATAFGLAPLVGKQVAFISDAHLSRSCDSSAILEALKRISGEDSVSVDRKYKDAVNVKLPTRFVIAANQLDQFPDPSGALSSRLIVFNYTHSFLGNEDMYLDEKLEAELPGIANWALSGLADLRKSGRLLQPKTGQATVEESKRLSSPIGAFVEDCCFQHGCIETSKLYEVWKLWCSDEGREPGSKQSFGARLKAVIPHLQTEGEMRGGKRLRLYGGVSLNENGTSYLF